MTGLHSGVVGTVGELGLKVGELGRWGSHHGGRARTKSGGAGTVGIQRHKGVGTVGEL